MELEDLRENPNPLTPKNKAELASSPSENYHLAELAVEANSSMTGDNVTDWKGPGVGSQAFSSRAGDLERMALLSAAL